MTPEQNNNSTGRDHGGGLDAAIARYGGTRRTWVDLSTGINPVPYPLPDLSADSWTALPDQAAQTDLITAARYFWNVPDGAGIIAAPGASCLIAALPALAKTGQVHIPAPTYNEHAAAFAAHGWQVTDHHDQPQAKVIVHPNNPTGHWYNKADANAPLTVIDESFADVEPDRSLISLSERPGVIVLKSFGKFWGLAGLRLGFAIALPETIQRLSTSLGPWPVSGPALRIGATALNDTNWAEESRRRLTRDTIRLDTLMQAAGADLSGGTSLFRLYSVPDAHQWQDRLARHHIWTRTFPYSANYLRLGLPGPDDWPQLEGAL